MKQLLPENLRSLVSKSLSHFRASDLILFFILASHQGLLAQTFRAIHPRHWQPFRFEAIFIVLLTGGLIVCRKDTFKRCLVDATAPLTLGIFGLLSTTWSVAPNQTLWNASIVAAATACGVLLAADSYSALMHRLEVYCLIAVAANCIGGAWLDPVIRLNEGWAGITEHRAILGQAMAFALICFSVQLCEPKDKLHFFTLIIAGVAALTALFLSLSLTAIIAFVICTGIIIWVGNSSSVRNKFFLSMLLMAYGSLCAFGWYYYRRRWFTVTDQFRTLNSRTEIWAKAIDASTHFRMFGYGMDGFFRSAAGRSVVQDMIMQRLWRPLFLDNGYLEILINFGVVGALFFGPIFAIAWWRAVKQAAPRLRIFPFIYMLFLTIINVTGGWWFTARPFYWIVFVAMYIHLQRASKAKTLAAKSDG